MKYIILAVVLPAMPIPGNGTEIIKFYLSQVSPETHKSIISMLFPAFSSHLQGVKLIYCNSRFLEFHT